MLNFIFLLKPLPFSLFLLDVAPVSWYNSELSENSEFTNYNFELIKSKSCNYCHSDMHALQTKLEIKDQNISYLMKISTCLSCSINTCAYSNSYSCLKPCHVTDLEMVNLNVFKEPMWISKKKKIIFYVVIFIYSRFAFFSYLHTCLSVVTQQWRTWLGFRDSSTSIK